MFRDVKELREDAEKTLATFREKVEKNGFGYNSYRLPEAMVAENMLRILDDLDSRTEHLGAELALKTQAAECVERVLTLGQSLTNTSSGELGGLEDKAELEACSRFWDAVKYNVVPPRAGEEFSGGRITFGFHVEWRTEPGTDYEGQTKRVGTYVLDEEEAKADA